MRNFIIIFCILFTLIFNVQTTVAALDYSKISTNAKITSALGALYKINRKDVLAILYGQNATKKPIRILFRDLSIFGYSDCEAVTAKTKNGGLVIYISSEHKGASPECLACLIAHEAQHHTYTNSKTEELRAWVSETQAWNEFVKRDKTLLTKNEPLAKRENYIAKLKSTNGVQGIKNLIASNPVYAELD